VRRQGDFESADDRPLPVCVSIWIGYLLAANLNLRPSQFFPMMSGNMEQGDFNACSGINRHFGLVAVGFRAGDRCVCGHPQSRAGLI